MSAYLILGLCLAAVGLIALLAHDLGEDYSVWDDIYPPPIRKGEPVEPTPEAKSRPRRMDYWVPGAQSTICNDCGNPSLAHSLAVWTEDGASYCPSCRPEIAASPIRKGEQP